MLDNRRIKLSGCLGDTVTILGLIVAVLSLGFAALAIAEPETVKDFIATEPTVTPHIITQVVEVEVTRVITLEQPMTVVRTPISPTVTPDVTIDTPPGTILNVGEIWYQGGMEAIVSNVNFGSNCFESTVQYDIAILNNSGQTLVMSVTDEDIRVFDQNNIEYYSKHCSGLFLLEYIESSLEAGDRYTEKPALRPVLESSTDQLTFVIEKAGRITNAKWVVDVPR